MKENFIEVDLDKIDKNKTTKNKILQTIVPKKRKVYDVKRIPSTTPKISERKIFIFDSNEELNNKNTINVNEHDEYTIIEMNERDKLLMSCYSYLTEKKKFLKESQIITLNIYDSIMNLTLVQIDPFFIIILDDERIEFLEYSREISFVDDKKKQITKRFIYNTTILNAVLKNLGFKSYYVKLKKEGVHKDNNTLNLPKEEPESESSEVSLDLFKIFNDNNIKYIFKENQRPILNNVNFFKRFSLCVTKLKHLNNNSKYYYKNSNNDFQKFNNYIKAIRNFNDFKCSQTAKLIYLYGPKRCSKTTFLLYMTYIFNINARTLYFNFNYLERKNILERKRIIYHELLYFCKDTVEMNKIEQKKIFNDISGIQNIMKFIYLILYSLLEVIDYNNNDIRRIIIIDNIYNNDEVNIKYLNNIIKLINNTNSNIKLIICGKGPYFNQIFLDFYINFQVMTNEDKFIDKEETELLYIYCEDKNELNKFIDNNEKIQNESIDENFLQNELKTKIYSFFGLYLAEELDNQKYEYQTIKNNIKDISQLPLEYFEIKIIKNNEFSFTPALHFSFYNDSFKKCLRNIIGYEIEKNTLTNLLKMRKYPKTFLGVCFEKLITLLLMHNKMNLENLIFQKNNIVEISEIAKLKEDNYSDSTIIIKNKDNPILVIQENFFGPLYDLLIITKRNNSYYSDFIQIGVDKTEQQINEIIYDLESKYTIYKQNILTAFNIISDYITVSFIFDYDTQRNKDFSGGVKICKNKNINYYLFSKVDCSLVELNDDDKNILVLVDTYYPSTIINENKKIIIEKKKKKKNNNKDDSNYVKITDFFKKDN